MVFIVSGMGRGAETMIPKKELYGMRSMRRAGKTYSEIGKRYGKSFEAVRAALRRNFPEEFWITKNAPVLTEWQKEMIRMHAGLLPRVKIAKLVKTTEGKVAEYVRRHRLEQTCVHGKCRNDVTEMTRFQICVSDFEGYVPEAIGNLFYLRPERVKHLIKEMKQSGEYDRHVGVFRHWNAAAYNKAVRRRECVHG